MTPMSDDKIDEIVRGFLACTLPKEDWTHAAHFAAALSLLRARGEVAARAEMPGLIRAYNVSVGGRNTETEGYHETITQASLYMAALALRAAKGMLLSDVLAALMAGPCGQSDWIFDYWTKDMLFTAEARREWVAPDLAPLPAG